MKFILAIETDDTDNVPNHVRPTRLEVNLSRDASLDDFHEAYLGFLKARTFYINKLEKLLIEEECVCESD